MEYSSKQHFFLEKSVETVVVSSDALVVRHADEPARDIFAPPSDGTWLHLAQSHLKAEEHQGSFKGGHYVAFVRSHSGQWHRMSDSSVMRVDEATALGAQAFLLFYERMRA